MLIVEDFPHHRGEGVPGVSTKVEQIEQRLGGGWRPPCS